MAASSTKVVAIIGALDTKAAEYAFLKQQIEGQGVGTLMIDVGIFGEPPFAPDISAAEVATAGGADRAALAAANDRGNAVGAMAAGAAIILKRLYDEGRVHGVIAMGGGGGTTLGSIAMQPLPVGAPKLIVSTVASGDTSAYVGVKDIAMMPSIVDVAGVNRLSSKIIANAAGAIAGMVKIEHRESSDAKPMIAATMFGVTTAGVTKAREIIEKAGYEVLVFHAVGSGGRTMEELIRAGFVAGVLDLTTTELADELAGGVLSAGPNRLEAAGETGVPQVVSLGALDMVNFGARDTIPPKYAERKLYPHNPLVTLYAHHARGERGAGPDHRCEAQQGERANGADDPQEGCLRHRCRGQALLRCGGRRRAVHRASDQYHSQCDAGRDGRRHQQRRVRD